MLSGYIGYGAADEGCAVSLGGQKTQGAHERAWGHSNSNRGRRRERRLRALIFPWEIDSSQILRPESEGFQQNLERETVAGRLLPCIPIVRRTGVGNASYAIQKVVWQPQKASKETSP